MRYKLTTCLLAGLLSLAGCGKSEHNPADLPWNTSLTPEGYVQAFQLQVGKSTLRDAINLFQSFPETAVFSGENKPRTLEAYFGKRRVGLFEAKIILELQASEKQLVRFEADHIERDGTASGLWKYTLSEDHVRIANDLPIAKLVYLPTIDYDPETISARFGEPQEKLPSKQEGVSYWMYPDKGLALLLNNDGGEILYFTPQANYAALKQELLEATPTNADE